MTDGRWLVRVQCNEFLLHPTGTRGDSGEVGAVDDMAAGQGVMMLPEALVTLSVGSNDVFVRTAQDDLIIAAAATAGSAVHLGVPSVAAPGTTYAAIRADANGVIMHGTSGLAVIDGVTALSNGLTVYGASLTCISNPIFAASNVMVSGALTVGGSITTSNAANLAGGVNVGGTLTLGSATLNNKMLSLYDQLPTEAALTASNFYGFGVNNGTLRYQAVGTSSHKWYSGATNTLVLDGSGNLVATANVSAYSDARLKEGVERISDALAKIGQLGGYTYTRVDIPGGKRSTGVIAQEVQKVLPEAVQTNSGGLLSVSYGNMVGLLIEGIKELAARSDPVDASHPEGAPLHAALRDAHARIDVLESAVGRLSATLEHLRQRLDVR